MIFLYSLLLTILYSSLYVQHSLPLLFLCSSLSTIALYPLLDTLPHYSVPLYTPDLIFPTLTLYLHLIGGHRHPYPHSRISQRQYEGMSLIKSNTHSFHRYPHPSCFYSLVLDLFFSTPSTAPVLCLLLHPLYTFLLLFFMMSSPPLLPLYSLCSVDGCQPFFAFTRDSSSGSVSSQQSGSRSGYRPPSFPRKEVSNLISYIVRLLVN